MNLVAPFARREFVGNVRQFDTDDIPQIASLHRKVFKPTDAGTDEAYRAYFTTVFLGTSAGEGTLPSLVYEDDEGRIAGFLGVVSRSMVIDGRRFQAAVSSQFIVDPASRAGLVALRLLKTFLEGPQDLSIADEANDVSRKLWEGLGGTTALLLSLYWTRALRPARLALSYLRQRRALTGVAAAAGPVAAVADSLAARVPGSHFRQAPPSTLADDLRGPGVLAHGPAFDGAGSLRVEHGHHTFQWLLDRAARRYGPGRLLSAVVRNGQSILGWYICCIDDEGNADAVQITATASSIHEVLDHLFYHAWRRGAVAVTGRLDPRFMQALSDKYCLFHRRGPWVLVNTRRPEILQSFQTGDARFSRFDGEWSLRFLNSRETL